MKTRTRQNGIAGIMSRLLHNIKSAALALAALALAAPPVWGATKVWKDGVSGKISAASSWLDNTAWPTGGNPTRFGNTKGGIAKVENDYSMTTGNKMTDFFVQDGDFEITATKTIYHNNFYLINGGNSDFAPGTRASVLKKGDWTCIGYEFILGGKSGVTVAFTNQTGNCADIGKSRTTADRIPFQVAGWGSNTKTAPASPYSNIYAEFVVNDGSVTVAGCGNAGIACAKARAYEHHGAYYLVFGYPTLPRQARVLLSEFDAKKCPALTASRLSEYATLLCPQNAVSAIGQYL